jgi:predicted Zn-dependent protease
MATIRKHLRPVFVMFQDGISQVQIEVVLSSINMVLLNAGVNNLIRVTNFGVWRNSGYQKNGKLLPYQSVDWYIARGFQESRNNHQAYVREILVQLWNEPWQIETPHYDVVVLHSDIYDDNCNFVIGSAIKGFGMVISINRFEGLEHSIQIECIKTEVMHEVGHVFGLVPNTRTSNITESLGRHCTNQCVMRQGLAVPHAWIRYSKERLSSKQAFCSQCQQDLRNYFR